MHKLPRANWCLIRALSAFLIGIVNNSDINKMGVRNVGIVFSPTLNIPAPVFSMFLTDFDAIFGEEPAAASTTPPPEVSVSEPLTPEDVRSPRRQIFSDIPTPSYNQNTFPSQATSYDQAFRESHQEHDTGFIPLQPSYEPPAMPPSKNSPSPPQAGSVTKPGPEYGQTEFGVISRARTPQSAAKSRRRESSMLLMSNGLNDGQRKSSMPHLRADSGS